MSKHNRETVVYDLGKIKRGEAFTVKGIFNSTFKVKYLSPFKHKALVDKYTETTTDKTTKAKETEIDLEGVTLALVKECLIGWSNLIIDGVEFPFNDENRDWLALNFMRVQEIINTICVNAESLMNSDLEAQRKN